MIRTCYKMSIQGLGHKAHSATPIAYTNVFTRLVREQTQRPSILPFTQARYYHQGQASSNTNDENPNSRQAFRVGPGVIGGLAVSHIHQDTAHAAPPPFPFNTTKNWSVPNITGGAPHSISACVQGQAIFSMATGKIECVFTFSVTLNVTEVRTTYPVEQPGKIGFIGRDTLGNVLWNTPKGYYSPGPDQHEIFSVDKELLEKTARVDVMFEISRPTLTQYIT